MLQPLEVMYFSNFEIDISEIVGVEIVLDSQLGDTDCLRFDLGFLKNLADLFIHERPSISSRATLGDKILDLLRRQNNEIRRVNDLNSTREYGLSLPSQFVITQ